uniref:hypothetical protein n=1 Tax=Methanobrevibacter smithii TaxID=2173 RepID=UPI0037DCBA40
MMENEHKTYIDNMKLGDIVAFKLYEKDSKMYSGKIKTLGASKVEIQTKNGKKFIIEKKNIFWVNVNNRWPRFVMNAFKGVDIDTADKTNENNKTNENLEEESKIENKVEEIKAEDDIWD